MRKIAMLLILALCLTVVSFPVSAVTGVSTVDLADLDVPLAGAKPDTTVTMRTSGYQIHSLDWYDVTADRYLNAGDKFIDGNVIDDTGAGDAFNGGVLHGIASGMSPYKAATLGSIVAGLQIRGVGAIKSTPSKEDVYSIFKGQNG